MADTPHSTEHDYGPTRITVDRTDEDRYSVVVGRIRADRTDGAASAPSAGRIAETVDYLGERLRLIETEPDEALVRSAAPVQSPDGKQYYELRFQGDGMTMERKQADGDGTATVPFVLPKPTLDRLVDDLGRLVGNAPAPAAAPEPPPAIEGDLFHGHKGCC
jgi:hypothetical protein